MADEAPPKVGFRTHYARIEFDVYEQPATPPKKPGVYALVTRNVESGRGLIDVLYIGETGDLSDVAIDHPAESCLKEMGFNAIAILPEADAEKRSRMVTNLLDARNAWPRCQPQPD